jgi:uncharacterized protein (TIGR03435 family)
MVILRERRPMLNTVWFASVAWLLTATISLGQEKQSPHFEVASVRQVTGSRLGSFSGGPGSNDPERITYEAATLEILIQGAYDVLPDQISGPDWLRSDLYAVTAKLPPGTTGDQFREMMANLLAERFGLVVHHVSKEISGYDLVVMPGGPELGAPVEKTERFAPFANRRGEDGLMHCSFGNTSMTTLANRLGMVLRTGQLVAPGSRPELVRVVDQTGVAGRFDFKLEFPAPSLPGLSSANRANIAPEDVPALVNDALKKQLGLKLTPAKIKLDMVVVDHAERVPSAN